MTNLDSIRIWLFRSLLFEVDAENFRSGGLRVGSDQADVERLLLEEALAPFALPIRNQALSMARLYTIVFCFENSVRQLIRERLLDAHDSSWWDESVPKTVRDFAQKRKESAEKNAWLEGDKSDLMQFLQFGHLADIIISNWDNFSDLIPSQHWIKQRMDDLEQARNFIAHNRSLLPNEYARIETYVNDWNRQVGL